MMLVSPTAHHQKEDTRMDENSLSHTRWNCIYHIVFIPKYRRKEIYGKLSRVYFGLANSGLTPYKTRVLRRFCRMSNIDAWETIRPLKNLAPGGKNMYRKPSPQMTLDDFILPFAGGLSVDNRWVRLAKLIHWDEIEKEYAFLFPSDRGNVAKPVRMALGSLIIQARGGYTDRELLAQIAENPYLQYFIGLKEFQLTKPFTPAALVKFRKRFNHKRLAQINELILAAESAGQKTERKRNEEKKSDDDDHSSSGGKENNEADAETPENLLAAEPAKVKEKPNQGTLILDATCTPADIHYPTDIRLLNEATK
jgi:hypothetical protein